MVTFGGDSEDSFNLNAPVAGITQNAQIRGNSAVLRSALGYVAASRAAQGTTQAFVDATKYLVGNMYESMSKIIEIEMFYGQMGLATVASSTGNVVTITTAEWAPGIWAGAEKMPIEIRDTTGATSRGEASVVSVDMDLRTVTLNALPIGTVATDVIWRKGAFGKEFVGIHKALSQSTGTLFGISVTDYNLFRGNVYDASSAALSFAKLQQAIARAVEKGLQGTLNAFVNPRAWANLLTNEAALRMYDSSYSVKKAENGAEKLIFHSQNGTLEIEPSIYVKEGYAYLLSLEDWVRVGSSDISFDRPGQNPGEYFRDLTDAAGYELRLFTDQAIFTSSPGRNVLIKNIVNAAS